MCGSDATGIAESGMATCAYASGMCPPLARGIGREAEVVLEFDGVGDAQHDRHLRLLEPKVLERERGRRRPDDVLPLGSRGDVPGRRVGDAVDCEIATK